MKILFANPVSMPTLIEAVDTCGWFTPAYAHGKATAGARTGKRTPTPQPDQP